VRQWAENFSIEQDDEPAVAQRCIFVLFGCSGDLAARKIAPALYNLEVNGRLRDNVAVLAVSRREWDDETLRGKMREAIEAHSRREPDEKVWNRFRQRWHYQRVQADEHEMYKALAERLHELDERYDAGGSRVFYISMAPEFFREVTGHIGQVGLNTPGREEGFCRLVVEKPFGHDLQTARELNEHLKQYFREDQLYRIDHYLGKETVQNILVFRFANSLFDPHFDASSVDNVQITTAEDVGMEGRRGPLYESTGALRDMVQNHMLQLLALVAMDRPDCLRCEAVRDAKARLLKCIRPLREEEVAQCVVRGQYLGGDDDCPAYREEEGVDAHSQVETFAALRLLVDNERWSGVPFFLRTGKRLATKASYIAVTFKRERPDLFELDGCDLRSPNRLVMRITPNEGIALRFDAKVPGSSMLLRPVEMDFEYQSTFASASPEAYEHLLLDVMRGDPTLFIRDDEVEASWRVVDSIRTAWDKGVGELEFYEPGGWGPAQAEQIFANPYRGWYCP
jgi:glucose-6-phosphate 1-dehydrogenase